MAKVGEVAHRSFAASLATKGAALAESLLFSSHIRSATRTTPRRNRFRVALASGPYCASRLAPRSPYVVTGCGYQLPTNLPLPRIVSSILRVKSQLVVTVISRNAPVIYLLQG